jgi:GTP-binding protein Era
MTHRAGFVNIIGRPNAGKSTLLNALTGEKLAIVSPKAQTTRDRIMGILTTDDYQIVFSDTPGIIEPDYKLHEKMMQRVKIALEDADVALLLMDATGSPEKALELFSSLPLQAPRILVANKTDLVDEDKVQRIQQVFGGEQLAAFIAVSATRRINLDVLLQTIVKLLPESPPYYPEDMLTEKPVRFFAGELIREQVYALYREEIPYHTTVLVNTFQEKTTLTKIVADIIVQRETQKAIILGSRGSAIKELGTLSRKSLEEFLGRKVFLELHVKVRSNWRDKDTFLREYGYR